MSDEVRDKLKRLGKNQRRIVLWLGDQHGVTTLDELKGRWPASKRVPSRTIADLVRAIPPALQEQEVATPYAPYLREAYFHEQGDERLLSQGWIPWDTTALLGHPPSSAESTLLSKGIRQLEARELVETTKAAGKHTRITHVKLTFFGEVASVLLRREGT